jgi:hypothetical protein
MSVRGWRLSRPQGQRSQKDYVNLKNPPHRDLNPRRSGLQHSALTTTLPSAPYGDNMSNTKRDGISERRGEWDWNKHYEHEY